MDDGTYFLPLVWNGRPTMFLTWLKRGETNQPERIKGWALPARCYAWDEEEPNDDSTDYVSEAETKGDSDVESSAEYKSERNLLKETAASAQDQRRTTSTRAEVAAHFRGTDNKRTFNSKRTNSEKAGASQWTC